MPVATYPKAVWAIPCAYAHAFLFGLAPGGVYLAVTVTSNAVRSYRTISPLPIDRSRLAVYFLLHLPWTHAPQVLPGTLPYGARTFLLRLNGSDYPADSL